MSYELPKIENDVPRTNEKPGIETLLNKAVNTNPVQNSEKFSERTLPSDSGDVRFKAMTENQNNQNSQNNQKSSTLDKYETFDIIKDWLLPPNDIFDVIGNIKNKDYLSAITDVTRNIFPGVDTVKDVSRSVWKAGSELYLRPNGWDISADMLEHSLQEKPKDVVFYDDSDVAKKIKTNPKLVSEVDKIIADIENGIESIGCEHDINFEANDDLDLYYSIHGCDIIIDNIIYNSDGSKDISVHIHDTYDYTKIWTAMDEKKLDFSKFGFGSLANDLGTFTTKYDAINPYEVDIYFTIRR